MDNEDTEALEDGELSNDSDTYTPLERPVNYAASQPNPRFPTVPESESEPEIQSTDSDSDSDCKKPKNKKPKIKLKPKLQAQHARRKKYDIWSTRVQEDVLAETLNSCDVTKKDRSRDVESYDYLGHQFYSRKNNKRTANDRRDGSLRSVGKSKEEKVKGSPRLILDLTVDANCPPEDIAKDIANKLCEQKEDLIIKVVKALGSEKTIQFFNETKKIEEEGGMLIMNQARRRTPGGVFLFLIRRDDEITTEQRENIFDDDRQKSRVMVKNKQKKKMKKLKEDIAASKAKLLPELLTRPELLARQSNRERKSTDERDVINPPPTPETDGHENSGDGMDGTDRKLQSYDDDFLDIGCSNDMDLF